MFKPLMNLIDTFEQFNIDVLHYISIASCAYATKYYSTYFPSKFNLECDKQTYYFDFDINADYSNPNPKAKLFELTARYWKNKCYQYKQQDYKAGRETEKNVTADDYDYYKRLFETSVCSICSAKFTYDNPPSLDRQDNELPHTKANCLPACVSCNVSHANKDPKIASLHIKMRQYAIKNNLPMTISDERIYKLLRKCVTGRLAAVFHRENSAGKTHINELTYDKQSNKVISQDNENVATHVFALDEKPYVVKNCIDQRKDIFVAKVQGYFPKSEYNNLLALPPIFRNIEIKNKKKVIGEYMYSQAQKHSLPMTKKDKKFTTLLDTNGQFMVFNNYYLWLLIDLGFIITDCKAIAVFEKNAAYEPFVRTMKNLRIQAILAGSSKEKFYKLIINASYGYDTLNTEKFGKRKMLDKAGTFIAQHHPNHIDRKRFHFVLADTDSIYIAIAGNPAKDYIYDYKKILGFGIENEGYEFTSLEPKCYSMIVHKWSKKKQKNEFKPKITSQGISKSQQISHNDYVNVINKDIVKKGINGTFKMYDNVMSSIQVEKLTAKDYQIKDQ
ncbi:MAG: hypothetical protein EZS28_003365 [Streblomastix strix]|uniref:DNA-directed DNA polymerase n=1 Tax=Streblomastix strix TaxID=222440 RepID=A0A5J4X1C0_9EUKA|nr:MAG: hypothetical protein EZS28_003365 [Streblomastix strix]